MINILDYFVHYIMEATKRLELLKDASTFMVNVCNELKLYENERCMEWFAAATNHCFQLTFATQKKSTFWDILQEMLFEARNFSLVDPKRINRHPTHLSLLECEKLLIEMNNDYLNRLVPRERKLVSEFWQLTVVICSLIILIVCIKVVKIIVRFIKIRKNKQIDISTVILKSAEKEEFKKKHNILINQSVRTMKYEVEHLKVYHQFQLENLFPNREVPTLLLKNSTKHSFIQSIVHSESSTIGRFYNLRKKGEIEGKSYFTSTTTVEKVLQYINKFNKRPLQILVLFDDDEEFAEIMPAIPQTQIKYPTHKRASILERKKPTDFLPVHNPIKSMQRHCILPLPKVSPQKYERSGSESQICSKVSATMSASQLQRPNIPACVNGVFKKECIKTKTSKISYALHKKSDTPKYKNEVWPCDISKF